MQTHCQLAGYASVSLLLLRLWMALKKLALVVIVVCLSAIVMKRTHYKDL